MPIILTHTPMIIILQHDKKNKNSILASSLVIKDEKIYLTDLIKL